MESKVRQAVDEIRTKLLSHSLELLAMKKEVEVMENIPPHIQEGINIMEKGLQKYHELLKDIEVVVEREEDRRIKQNTKNDKDMKTLADGFEVSARSYYFLLDWNEANERKFIISTFKKERLMDLTREEYRTLLDYATKVELQRLYERV